MIFIDLFSPSFISKQIGSAREPCPLGTLDSATQSWELLSLRMPQRNGKHVQTSERALAATAESPAEKLSCCRHSANTSLLAEPSCPPSANISQRINDCMRERSCLSWVWRYMPRTLTLGTQRQEYCPKLKAILDSVARLCLKKVAKRKSVLD